MTEVSDSKTISKKLQRIAKLAGEDPQRKLYSLAHHIDTDFLKEAYRRTRKTGAVGVDGRTAAEYAENLEGNLEDLRERFRSGRYKAPPVRRVHIPKGSGRKTRPIGIPTFEDKLLQRAVTMLLEAVYEQDFLDCSYGFRPNRGAHDAVWAAREGLMKMGGGWVIELDIEDFFGTLDHAQLRAFLDRRVTDGTVRRTVHKWLKAGVMEDGCVSHPDTGTPQGGVISPLLANVYLHEVVDTWFEHTVKPRLVGRGFMVRYADDAVLAFVHESDARRTLRALPKRLERFGLRMHPEKTRLVHIAPPRSKGSNEVPALRGSFNFLGFTLHWAKSRKGRWVVKMRTAKDRFTRALKEISAWCRRNRHERLSEQHRTLCQKVRGHFSYYGVTGNYEALARFVREVGRRWKAWLGKRSQRAILTWDRFNQMLQWYPLPRPRVVHNLYLRSANPMRPRSRMR